MSATTVASDRLEPPVDPQRDHVLGAAAQAFAVVGDFAAAKIAVFMASIVAAAIGVALLWRASASAPPVG